MSVRTCDHLKEDGVFCHSPALRGRNYCYFHLNLRGRRLKMARARARGHHGNLNLPFPEDMHAVQVSLAEVLFALADDRIDPKRAGLMLYALQQASTNLHAALGWEGSREEVEREQPLRALEFPAFEEKYDLPEGVDLEAEPDTALNEIPVNETAPPIDGQNPDAQPAAQQHRRLARVPMPRYEEEEVEELSEQEWQDREDANALEWFFHRIGIDPPAGSVPKKPTQEVA